MISIKIRFKAHKNVLPSGYVYLVDSAGIQVVDSLGRLVIAKI
jgi:hypothetical protein